jgi:hypothetical protein
MATDKAAQQRIKKKLAGRGLQVDRFLGELKLLYRGSIKELAGIMERNPDIKALEKAALVNSLESILINNGFEGIYNQQLGMYRNELSAIREEFTARGTTETVGRLSEEAIFQLADFESQKIAKTLESFQVDVKASLYRSYILGEPVQVDDLFNDFGERTFNNLRAELNTAMSTFARTVTAEAAQDAGFELYLYIGADDSVTRDFCGELLSKDPPIYTAEEIDSMDNGQLPDVMTTGGGYNCRHQWSPVSLEFAKSLGYVD